MEKQGLYWQLYGKLPPEESILHLFFENNSLGVFCPENGHLVFRRKISQRELPILPKWAIAWCNADTSWTPQQGKQVRFFPTHMDIGVPWELDKPMELPGAPGQLRLIEHRLVQSVPYAF